MIWLCVKHDPQIHGNRQFVYCYQYIYPALRGGIYLDSLSLDN